MSHLLTEEDIMTTIQLTKLYHEETSFQRIPMEVESHLLDVIRQGKYEEFKVSSFDKIKENHGSIIQDSLKDFTYVVISAIAIFSRAAIEAGAVPDDAFDLSDALLFRLSSCTTQEEVHNIYQLSSIMFAKLVRQRLAKPTQAKSYQVEKMLTYIGRNIFHKITLASLAEYVGLSTSHLSRLFSQEMGISIHNYVQREKTNIACNLLMHTDRPISEIATYLGFPFPSNFAIVFRKWQKKSPTEYRTQMYREVY